MGCEYLVHLAIRDTRRKAMLALGLWTAAALVLAALLVPHFGSHGAVEYLAGYAIEQALSIDNLFVFLLLFGLFRIPEARQPRVLFWGVAGAIVMRGTFIAAGVGLLQRFAWISYIFGAILLYAAVKMLQPEDPKEAHRTPRWLKWLGQLSPVSEDQHHFFVTEVPANSPPATPPRRMMTTLFLALVAIELTDIVFALDSIPAVLSITRVPFLAYTSNIMAVMSLRSVYILLAAMLKRFRYIHDGLAAVLAFAALKMLLTRWIEIGPVVSLIVIAVLLGTAILASLHTQNRRTENATLN